MESKSGTVVLGREEFYEQVWAEPMVRLAKRFAVTDVALAKTCRRMGIPVPPRGYWRRKQTGYHVSRPALPPLRAGMSTKVELRLRQPSEVAFPPNPEVEAQKAFEARPENRIVVAQRLASPHSLVERTRAAVTLAKPGSDGRLHTRASALDLRVTPRLLPRALRIIDALAKALEARGARVTAGGPDRGETAVEILGERLPMFLEEPVTQTRHVLTEAEHRHPYRAARWDYTPTGKLKIQIGQWTRAHLRKRWADASKGPLEDKLNEVVLGLVLVADTKRAERLQAEREERERQEAMRRRLEAEQRHRQELERRDVLERQVESWTKARQIRAFVDAVERRANVKSQSTKPGTELGGWIVWARQHADRLDPLKPPLLQQQ